MVAGAASMNIKTIIGQFMGVSIFDVVFATNVKTLRNGEVGSPMIVKLLGIGNPNVAAFHIAITEFSIPAKRLPNIQLNLNFSRFRAKVLNIGNEVVECARHVIIINWLRRILYTKIIVLICNIERNLNTNRFIDPCITRIRDLHTTAIGQVFIQSAPVPELHNVPVIIIPRNVV